MEKLVGDVHKDLLVLQHECTVNRENPRLLKLIDALLRLTDVDDDYQSTFAEHEPSAATAEALDPEAEAPEKPSAEDCPHSDISPFRVCRACGTEFDVNGKPLEKSEG